MVSSDVLSAQLRVASAEAAYAVASGRVLSASTLGDFVALSREAATL